MTIHIFGGGTHMYVRSHCALSAPARGRTARRLAALINAKGVATQLQLTALGDPDSDMETNDDVEKRLLEVLADPTTSGIIFNVALCDVSGQIGDVPSGKYAKRLKTREFGSAGLDMVLHPTKKLLGLVRQLRPDVPSVGFKTTTGDDPALQIAQANRMAGEHGISWMLANDTGTRHNIVLKGGGDAQLADALYAGQDREAALAALVDAFLAEVRRG